MAQQEYAWHVHHDVMVEALTEPIETRAAYITENKEPEEVPLRARLLKRVQGALPTEVVQAEEARDQAREAYHQAREACGQARGACDQREARDQAEEAYFQAWEACAPAIEALHAQECPDCPWDGHTIFTRKNEAGEWA